MTRFQRPSQARAPSRQGSKCILATLLLGVLLAGREAHAMSPEQMKALAGAGLLDVRVDALFRQCGLPSTIVDSATRAQPPMAIRWGDIEMQLSPMDWEMVYSRRRAAPNPKGGWNNPGSGSGACLSGLSGLTLHARGQAGILSVTKRADGNGYLTSYDIPDSVYAAHLVIGITGNWKRDTPISKIEKWYGEPDEIVDGEGGIRRYRYWVVAREKEMPVSVHAVDFEITGAEEVCTRYTVRTSGFEFVQQKLDALQREWEKNYVLD